MLPNCDASRAGDLTEAQSAALGAIASVVVAHLDEDLNKRSKTASAPVLIQIDGPNHTELVEVILRSLESPDPESQRWVTLRFDAWQYQRVKPPWWWLLTAVDQQLRAKFRNEGWRLFARKRLSDYAWRTGQLLADLLPVLPLAIIALGLWYVTGRAPMGEYLKWVAGVLGGIATLATLIWTLTNAVRRLLVASPINAGATARASDPLVDFQRRYSFLVRSAEDPVAIVIDNLDRCHGDYVVELLEGIQTLLKSSKPTMQPTPLVAVFVPAERRWLCDSYLQEYREFPDTARQPGRPFGLTFIDKVFDYELRLPVIPGTALLVKPGYAPKDVCAEVAAAQGELETRGLVADAERSYLESEGVFRPFYDLRVNAVKRLGWLEVHKRTDDDHGGDDLPRLCFDTREQLNKLIESVGADPTVIRQLRTAYCVERTQQMLGGHQIDDRGDAILRLGLWTVLGIRWPLLTQHLAHVPEDLEALLDSRAPAGVEAELASVFEAPDARCVVTACAGVELTADDVRQFSAPCTARILAPAQVPVPEFA